MMNTSQYSDGWLDAALGLPPMSSDDDYLLGYLTGDAVAL